MEPLSSSDSTLIPPMSLGPNSFARLLDKASPIPQPCVFRLFLSFKSTLLNNENINFLFSLEMPIPVSDTSI